MQEREQKEITVELPDWCYTDITLAELRAKIEALIAEHGEDAVWHAGVEYESLSIELVYNRPETDEELAQRQAMNAHIDRQRALALAAWDKLTPEERLALCARKPHIPSW